MLATTHKRTDTHDSSREFQIDFNVVQKRGKKFFLLCFFYGVLWWINGLRSRRCRRKMQENRLFSLPIHGIVLVASRISKKKALRIRFDASLNSQTTSINNKLRFIMSSTLPLFAIKFRRQTTEKIVAFKVCKRFCFHMCTERAAPDTQATTLGDYFVIFCLFQCGVASTWNTYMQTQPQTFRVNHHNRRRERKKKINMENGSDQMWSVWRVFLSIPDEISPSLAQRLSSSCFRRWWVSQVEVETPSINNPSQRWK